MRLLADLRQAIKAHNARQECSVNDCYNAQKKLGSFAAHCVCRSIAHRKYGICGGHKISWKDAVEWARYMLPPGMGYPNQDITPINRPYVAMLVAAA